MYRSALIAVLVLADCACTATFKATIRESRHAPPIGSLSSSRSGEDVQRPLRNPSSEPNGDAHNIPMKDFMNVIYTANISVGTPPQQFSLAVDLMSNTLLVPSVTCKYLCNDHWVHNRYNSSLSSTHKPNGSSNSVEWGDVNYSGFLSSDTVHMADLDIQDMLFEEWSSAICISVLCFQLGYEGVLGLAPPWNKQSSSGRYKVPNTLSYLLSQDLLDSPIFSLKLPRNRYEEGDEEGELLFGATNPDLHIDEPITLPVINVTDNYFRDFWTVPATHIAFDTPIPITASLPNVSYAVLDSANPWLILPGGIAKNMTKAIGAERGPYFFTQHIPCDRRHVLPELTFQLGDHNFSIDAFDYTLEVDLPNQGRACITTFWDSEDFWGKIPDGEPQRMLLGSPFVRKFYSVFDMGKREVGLAELKTGR